MTDPVHSRLFERSSPIPTTAEDLSAWHFRPGAFQRLAPPWERIELLRSDGPIGEGSRVEIRMHKGPLPVRWVAEHRQVQAGRGFKDIQVKGPFRFWEHHHAFEATGPGASRLTDRIRWALPGGRVGAALGAPTVERDLQRTFRYRHAVTAADLRLHSRWRGRRRLRVALVRPDLVVAPTLEAMLTTGGHQIVHPARRVSRPASPGSSGDSRDGRPATGIDALVIFESNGDEPAGEGRRLRDLLSRSPQATTLLIVSPSSAAELSEPLHSRPGGRRVVVRLGSVLHPRAGCLARLALLTRLGVRAAPGGDRGRLSWITADDAAAGILHLLLEDDFQGEVDLASPRPVSSRELTGTLAGVLNRPLGLSPPSSIARRLLGRAARELQGGPAIEPARLLQAGFEFRHTSLEGALRHILGRES